MTGNKKLTDKELVAKVQGGAGSVGDGGSAGDGGGVGDYEAFEELVKRYERRIYGHSLRLLGNKEDAEDVLQETFLNVFRAIKNFRGDSSFSTWIYRIATNNALMKLRKSGRVEVELDDNFPNIDPAKGRATVSYIEGPGDALIEKEVLAELDNAVKKLPKKYRTIFLLRDVEEFSTAETAEILDITESAVKSRLHRARLFLRKGLSQFKEGVVSN